MVVVMLLLLVVVLMVVLLVVLIVVLMVVLMVVVLLLVVVVLVLVVLVVVVVLAVVVVVVVDVFVVVVVEVVVDVIVVVAVAMATCCKYTASWWAPPNLCPFTTPADSHWVFGATVMVGMVSSSKHCACLAAEKVLGASMPKYFLPLSSAFAAHSRTVQPPAIWPLFRRAPLLTKQAL
jgi:hypothetical protein